MASWAEFAVAEPELAREVQARFGIRKHNTLATLRKDGSPRISGIEVEFADGELFLGMMPDSRKLHDLRRDPRMALHSPTEDPPDEHADAWRGEAKVAGRAVEVRGANRVRIDIGEVVLTHLNQAGDRLVVESWHPDRGRRRLERT
ncbi:MAG TPA: pyridoxamine 5'-phosphate oxidase family protein [Candidatus Dormibacteraeota bacterium]|nr:pyridoxamine 5'-phosphate oxidase family protein [Candidatus Dormibacteraeota bacterium]